MVFQDRCFLMEVVSQDRLGCASVKSCQISGVDWKGVCVGGGGK